MNKIYHNNHSNSHRSNAAQGAAAGAGAGAGANATRVGGSQTGAVTTPASATQPQTQSINLPNNNNHGHHQHHHPRQQGHNPHQQHHHHQHHQHHHQQQQQQPQQPQQQQQQQHNQHHHQQQQQHPQQHPQPMQTPQQQQHHHHHNQHQHHHHHQSQAYLHNPNAQMTHDVLDHQHHPQQSLQAQQVHPGSGVTQPQAPNQQQTNQHNPLVKHHSQAQPTSNANPHIHSAQQPQPHHHQNHHHNPQHHSLHHPTQMPLSPSIQQQWSGPQSSQAQHHHPQQLPQQQQQQQQSAEHHQPQQQSQQPQQPPQQQQPPPQPQQQQQQPQQQPPHTHHINHPPPPQMMINPQYGTPNAPFIYTQLNHHYAPPGHIPSYDHSSAVASHQTDTVNINSQPHQPVSINNHHPGNMPLSQMPPVISTATTGATNVHQINNGPLEAHMSNRPPFNQPQYIMSSPYIQTPFMLPYLPYTSSHLPSPSSTMIPPPLRVASDLVRQPYEPQNQSTPLPVAAALGQLPGTKPPVLPRLPVMQPAVPLKPREKKALAIVDPKTKHVFTEAELKNSTSTPQSPSSTDSGPPRISPEDTSISDKEPTDENVITKSAGDTNLSDTKQLQQQQLQEQKQPPPPQPAPPSEPTLPAPPEVESSEPEADTRVETAEPVAEEEIPQTREESKDDDERSDDLPVEIAALSISADNKTIEESDETEETPVKKPTLPNLPYVGGQYSPSNRDGFKRYSIEFLRAVAKEMNYDFDAPATPNLRVDFAPHYVNLGASNYRDHSSSQPLTRRSSQQVINKPRKVINTHSLQQEVELKTAEKPWKPELETDKKVIVESGEMDTKRLLKVFRGHLNKLTPQKYDSLIEKIEVLDLDGPERLNSVIDLVFDKAVDEPGFCELYARMCKVIARKDTEFCFHLVRKCQEEFETSDLYDGLNVEERKLEIEKEEDPAKKKSLSEELYEDQRLRRKKYLGTIKLIGEMYKLGLLLPKIIGLCMTHLIRDASNENIECLCSLIATVGAKMASEPDDGIKGALRNTLNILHSLTHSKKTDELFVLESRIKFKIQDTIDLSRRSWKPRMVENNPKKIEELHEEVKEEQMRQQHQNHDRARRAVGSLYPSKKYCN